MQQFSAVTVSLKFEFLQLFKKKTKNLKFSGILGFFCKKKQKNLGV